MNTIPNEPNEQNRHNKPDVQGQVVINDSSTVKGPVTGTNVGTINVHYTDEQHDVQGLPNPYLGLRTFTYDDRTMYAGRERTIAIAEEKLTTPGQQQVLLFITGASGSGKSSLAQAGIIPALEHHYQHQHLIPRYTVFRPSMYPLTMLTNALRLLQIPVEQIDQEAIQQKPSRFHTFLSHTTPNNQINLLVIDQFEELFTQSDPVHRDTLIAILEHQTPFDQLRTHIIITLRSDYLPELFAHQPLYDLCKQGLDLRAMTEDELRDTIQRPLQLHYPDGNKRFEAQLLNKLAYDAAADAAYLPLLQVTLEDLWKRGSLKSSAYGTLTDAIRRRAEDVYCYSDYDNQRTTERLYDNQQTILAIFLDLVEVSLDDDPRRDVRRRRTADDLHRSDPKREQIIKDLCQARLLSTTTETRDGQHVEVVDIIHETLIGNWDRLRNAIAEQRAALQQRVRFELALAEWNKHEQRDHYLLTGVRLAEAQALDERGDVALQNRKAQELLKQSVAQRERQRRVVVGTSLVAVVVFAVLAVAAGWFGVQARESAENEIVARQTAEAEVVVRQTAEAEALHKQQEAQRNEQIALSRQLAAQSKSMHERNLDLTLLLAVQSDSITRTAESKSALLDGIRVSPSLITTQRTHTDSARSVTFSPNGETLASASLDGTIQLWTMHHGMPIEHSILEGNQGKITHIAFNPEGTLLASASLQGTVQLWNTQSDEPVQQDTIQVSTYGIEHIAFSPDNTTLAAAAGDGYVSLWNIAHMPPQQQSNIHGNWGAVHSIAFSPDGKTLAVGTEGGIILLNSTNNPPVEKDRLTCVIPTNPPKLMGTTDIFFSVAFSPDGTLVAAGSMRDVKVWDMTTDSHNTCTTLPYSTWVNSVTFSPDGSTLIAGSGSGTVKLWTIQHDTSTEHTILSYADWAEDMVCNPTNLTTEHTILNHAGWVEDVACSPDGTILVAGANDGTVKVWNLTTKPTPEQARLIASTDGHEIFERASFSTNGSLLTMSSYSNQDETSNSPREMITRWDVTNDVPVTSTMLTADMESMTSVSFSPDGTMLASGTDDGTITLWDITGDTLVEQAILTGHMDKVSRTIFNRNGTLLASSACSNAETCQQSEIILWDVTHNPPTIQATMTGHSDNVTHISFSDDNTTLASSACSKRDDDGYTCIQGDIMLWDITQSSPSIHATLTSSTHVNESAFSPNGTQFAAGLQDGTVMLWYLKDISPTGQTILKNTTTGAIWSIAFSQDETTLAVGDSDGTIYLWDSTSQPPILWAILPIQQEGIREISFSPDGQTLISSGLRFLTILDISVESWKHHACRMVNRNLTWAEWRQYMGDHPYQKTCPDLPIGNGVPTEEIPTE